jgi:hypothetical protein
MNIEYNSAVNLNCVQFVECDLSDIIIQINNVKCLKKYTLNKESRYKRFSLREIRNKNTNKSHTYDSTKPYIIFLISSNNSAIKLYYSYNKFNFKICNNNIELIDYFNLYFERFKRINFNTFNARSCYHQEFIIPLSKNASLQDFLLYFEIIIRTSSVLCFYFKIEKTQLDLFIDEQLMNFNNESELDMLINEYLKQDHLPIIVELNECLLNTFMWPFNNLYFLFYLNAYILHFIVIPNLDNKLNKQVFKIEQMKFSFRHSMVLDKNRKLYQIKWPINDEKLITLPSFFKFIQNGE